MNPRLKEALWRALATTLSQPLIANWLIKRAQRTPYDPIVSRDGRHVYMQRWWLLNPYGKDAQGHPTPARNQWLPSVRVHHICLPDDDQHEHDHPWDARTIVLRGYYMEMRLGQNLPSRFMRRGHTARIVPRDYHRIAAVPAQGVYTLFFTWKHVEEWGFCVNGKKVPWRVYLATHNDKGAQP